MELVGALLNGAAVVVSDIKVVAASVIQLIGQNFRFDGYDNDGNNAADDRSTRANRVRVEDNLAVKHLVLVHR